MDPTTLNWIKSLSPTTAGDIEVTYVNVADENYARARVYASGSGHPTGKITTTAAGMVLLSLILLIVSAGYVMFRVYG